MIAFLKSLRAFNSGIQLVIIPFDHKTENLQELSVQYKFDIFQGQYLKTLDSIGLKIHPGKYSDSHMFRKFAAFWGPFDHFLFLDSDIVLLSDPETLLDTYIRSNVDLMHYDTSVQYVYKPGSFREEMTQKFGSTGFNTGCFASAKGKLTLDYIQSVLPKALAIKDNFACGGEQPFLNYCVDIQGLTKGTFFDSTDDLCKWTWGNLRPVRFAEGAYRLMDAKNPNYKKRMPFLHWSGILSSPVMPNRHLFLKYRLQSLPWKEQIKYLCYDWWQPGIRAVYKKLRRKKGMV